MKTFHYKVENGGIFESGDITAETRSQALDNLRGSRVISLREKNLKYYWKQLLQGNFTEIRKIIEYQLLNVSKRELSILFREIGMMEKAGSTPREYMRLLINTTKNKRFREVLFAILADIDNGRQLSEAFSRHPKVFPEITVNLIASAEVSGNIAETCLRIADQLDKDDKLISAIKSSMIYPVTSLIIIITLSFFILVYATPSVARMYEMRNIALPWYTQAMIISSDFFLAYWNIILPFVAVLLLLLKRLSRTKKVRLLKDRVCLMLPLVSTIIQKSNIALFARSLSSLLASSADYRRSIHFSQKVINNSVIWEAINEVKEGVQGGQTLSSSLGKIKMIPAQFSHLVKVGESTGQIDDMLNKVSDYYDDDVQQLVTRLSKLLEPALIVVLILITFMIAAALYLPLYSIMYKGMDGQL